MLELLLKWDQIGFVWINGNLSNPVFDALLPWCREKWIWAPLYVFLAAFLALNYPQKGLVLVLGLVLSVGLADFTSSALVKKNVQRIRPCNDPVMQAQVQRRVPCGSGYSFTSSHAANHFAAAVFLLGFIGRGKTGIRTLLPAWATLIAFSQVYVGVHYPLDVLSGALLGAGIAYLIRITWQKWLIRPIHWTFY